MTRKENVFKVWSWLKFTILGLVIIIAFNLYNILPKESPFWPTIIPNWVKTKILKFNRPAVNSICNDHHSKGVKLLTWLKLALSHLQESKFKHSYPFVNIDHNHIIAGKLEVISKKRSCKRFSKDPKYWQNRIGDCEKAKENWNWVMYSALMW